MHQFSMRMMAEVIMKRSLQSLYPAASNDLYACTQDVLSTAARCCQAPFCRWSLLLGSGLLDCMSSKYHCLRLLHVQQLAACCLQLYALAMRTCTLLGRLDVSTCQSESPCLAVRQFTKLQATWTSYSQQVMEQDK